MKTKLIACCLAAAASTVLFGCGDAPDEGGAETTTEASLSADVLPVFTAQCAGCHARENSPFPVAVVNGIYFETTDDILGNIGTFIVPGDSANSGLVGVLRQDFPVGVTPTLMPPPDTGAPAVTQAEVDLFARWIDEGAKDN